MKKLICACLAAVLLLSIGALADTYVAAKKLKPSDEVYVLDRSGVLTDATKGEILFSNDLLNEACGAQIAVVTLGTTGNEAIDDYATELFNTWGVGDAGKGNGFLLLLAIDDDDYYAVCGDGLQPKFTSGALKDYFDRYLEADFAARRYDAGVKKFFEAVFKRVADTYNADVTVEQGIAAYKASATGAPQRAAQFGGGSNRGRADDDDDASFGMILGVLVVIVLILLLTRTMRRRRYRRNVFVTPPPPPPPTVGPGGYRGVDNMPGAGGYRGPTPIPRRRGSSFLDGMFFGMLNSSGGSHHSSGGSHRSSGGGGFRSSGGGFRSSGGGSRSFGGGHSSGGGAGRGRH
ncbi:MAG: TPM domain-containing protein [Clostridia bacterium]|nr:TPM domain-containing protein [Clostridia bacterium]